MSVYSPLFSSFSPTYHGLYPLATPLFPACRFPIFLPCFGTYFPLFFNFLIFLFLLVSGCFSSLLLPVFRRISPPDPYRIRPSIGVGSRHRPSVCGTRRRIFLARWSCRRSRAAFRRFAPSEAGQTAVLSLRFSRFRFLSFPLLQHVFSDFSPFFSSLRALFLSPTFPADLPALLHRTPPPERRSAACSSGIPLPFPLALPVFSPLSRRLLSRRCPQLLCAASVSFFF